MRFGLPDLQLVGSFSVPLDGQADVTSVCHLLNQAVHIRVSDSLSGSPAFGKFSGFTFFALVLFDVVLSFDVGLSIDQVVVRRNSTRIRFDHVDRNEMRC